MFIRHALETKPGDLVERRSWLDENRYTAGDRGNQGWSLETSVSRCRAFSDQLTFGALDAVCEGSGSEQRRGQGAAPPWILLPHVDCSGRGVFSSGPEKKWQEVRRPAGL